MLFDKYLIEKYEISYIDALCCEIERLLHKSNKVPKYIRRRSKEEYGWRDNLGRYWYAKYRGTEIGKYTYGYEDFYRGSQRLQSIGAFCSIAHQQKIVPNDHRLDCVTTSPIHSYRDFGFVTKDSDYLLQIERNVVIGNDVWIGANCIIFEGVTIGDGAVIAAGSIVRGQVPPYAIVGGVDRILRYRFSPDIIEALLRIKWWEWTDEKIRENIDLMSDVQRFVKKFDKEYSE